MLTVLYIFGSTIEIKLGAGLEHLRGLPLKTLELECCKWLTDEGLALLKGLELTALDLGWCDCITDAGADPKAEALQQRPGKVTGKLQKSYRFKDSTIRSRPDIISCSKKLANLVLLVQESLSGIWILLAFAEPTQRHFHPDTM